MERESSLSSVKLRLVVRIVSSYVKHHQIGLDELAQLVASIHRSLTNGGESVASKPLTPAVPVRHSVHQNYVVCLDCGFRGQSIRRHLSLKHGLEPQAYRERWNLPADHLIVAPAYSHRRSTLAKQSGLGRNRPIASHKLLMRFLEAAPGNAGDLYRLCSAST